MLDTHFQIPTNEFIIITNVSKRIAFLLPNFSQKALSCYQPKQLRVLKRYFFTCKWYSQPFGWLYEILIHERVFKAWSITLFYANASPEHLIYDDWSRSAWFVLMMVNCSGKMWTARAVLSRKFCFKHSRRILLIVHH